MKRKRRQELFAFYDDTALKSHLEKMAKNGWMIEKMSNYFWTYVKTEPRDITFEITYHHAASEFDPHRSDDQETFDEFCEHTGWKLALSWHQMQIYYNEKTSPTPIQTDPNIRLEAMHKAMWSNYLISNIIILLISIPISVMFIAGMIRVPEEVIKSGTGLFVGILVTLLAVYTIFDLTVYFRWRKKALILAENGEFCPSPNTSIVQRCVIYFTYLILAVWLLNKFIKFDMLMMLSIFSYYASFAVAAIAVNKAKDMFKHLNVERDMNKFLSFIVALIVSFITVRFFIYIILLVTGNREMIELLF
ncbi:MAG: DUF2812 domain-containing protein [Eubacteriaceae bacterium]|nr:DUF2812 domain-containing protein [Eubacteriaceae bacterium]